MKLLEQDLKNELLVHNKNNFEEVRISNTNFQVLSRKIENFKTELKIKAPNGLEAFKKDLDQIPKIDTDFRLEYFLGLDKIIKEEELNDKRKIYYDADLTKISFEKKLNEFENDLNVCNGKISVITPKLNSTESKINTFVDVHGDLEFLNQNLVKEKLIFDQINKEFYKLDSQEKINLETAQAKFAMCEQRIENRKSNKVKLKEELSRLNGLIEGMAGDGIEEIIIETKDEIKKFSRIVQSIEYEIKVLQKLIEVLEKARLNARDTYLKPILNELKPLLKLIWPESDINFDDYYAPSKFFRNGREESIDTLSLGTQEQISLFVRLAFAKLFANSHGSIPVILDDAIIYSDDIRIKEIFTALHMQSSSYQIIVFSCRQRSFQDLGGNLLNLDYI